MILLFIPVLTGFAAVKNEPSAALTESVSNFVKETLQDKFKRIPLEDNRDEHNGKL